MMNKQELIEKAVLHFDGKWIFPFKNLCTPAETNTCYAPHSKFESIRNVYELGPNWIFVCTEEEFNAAADRMRGRPDWSLAPEWAIYLAQDENGSWWFYDSMVQSGKVAFVNPMGCRSQKVVIGKCLGDWRNTREKRPEQKVDPLNGYEWGKEYPTNGKRPDLPIDLEIETLSNCGGNWHKSIVGRPDWRFDGGMGDIVKFRITDQRYKPEPEPAPAKPWFEAGEFPPAGTECEVLTCGVWYKTKIVGMNDNMCVYVSKGFEQVPYNGESYPENFRHIKTEREMFIDAAVAASDSFGVTWVADTAGLLFDAGFRAPDQK